MKIPPALYTTFGTVAIALSTILAIVVLAYLEVDNTMLIITALLGFSGAIISAQQRETHLMTNSRMNELVAPTAKASKAEGLAEGKAEGLAEGKAEGLGG